MKKSYYKIKAILLTAAFALSVGNACLAVYNPNEFTLRQDVMQDALHDSANYDASRYQNYVNKDYDQRQYVENNDTGFDTLNSGVSQSQSGDMTVQINSVTVDPSEILKPEELSPIISSIQGRSVSMSEIQNAVNEINKLYASRGFVTARAYIPEQTITNGNLRIGLIESKVGNITVKGNRWTRTKYITDRVAQDKDSVFDIVELEKDVVSFNRYNEGVALKANLRAGQVPGTTDIEFNATEKFPFHLVGVMDNAGRYQTGHIRGGAMFYADSLFHNRDKMSLGSYFSGGATSPFFDYNIPVNKKDGRVGFLFSSTFSKVKYGPYKDWDLRSHGYQYSLYYSQPWIRKPDFEFGTYMGLNYKRSVLLSDYFKQATGNERLQKDEVTSADIAFNIRKDTRYGIWYLNQDFYYAFPIFDSASNYFKFSGGVTRLHDFSHGVVAQLRGNYQVIPNNKYIPYLDQMQSGGLFTVRGYNEGILLGKNGYFMSGELIFPIMPSTIKTSSREIPFLGRVVKGALFVDHAGIFPRRAEDYDPRGSYFLASVGAGLRVQLPGSLTGRLYWGFPLVNNKYETDRKYGRFHFELTLAPDFDALLRNRSTAVEEKRVKAQPVPAPALPEEPINNYPDVRHYDYFFDMPGSTL